MPASTPNADTIVDFTLGAANRPLPPEVADAARMALVDWFGVCLGAHRSPETAIVQGLAASWGTQGKARTICGPEAAPHVAALVNGVMSHCLDFDDTHLATLLHASGPTWATVAALGTARRLDESLMLSAFVTGFEVGTAVGSNGIGVRLNETGWHSTPVLGRFASTAAAAVLFGLDADRTADAFGLAGTQVSGFSASFGTMAKPFHAGKAAMDSVISAELAQAGFGASRILLDSTRSVFSTLFQDPSVQLDIEGLGRDWQITRNSYKPYPACALTHAAVDAAREVRDRIGPSAIDRVVARVNPLAITIAGIPLATTPTEGRFSLAYTIALALLGHAVSTIDFEPERLADPEVRALSQRVETRADDTVGRSGSVLAVTLADGRLIETAVDLAFGTPERPLTWAHLEEKFLGLARPVVGNAAGELFARLRAFETGALADAFDVVDRAAEALRLESV